jgi:hypothetical protein
MTDEELNARMFELNKLVLGRFIQENFSEEEMAEMLAEIQKAENGNPNPTTGPRDNL